MKVRSKAAFPAALAIVLALATAASGAMIGIYRNGMETTAQRGQLIKLFGQSCSRGGSKHSLQVIVGKRTAECAYRSPVVGRDLEVAATERLYHGTPKGLQRKVFLGLVLRAGGGSRYQLAVYPLQRKVQLRKYRADGSVKYMAIEKNVSTVKGLDKANKLRLSAVNLTSGPEQGSCRLRAYVGNKLVADVADADAGELAGRASGVAIGSAKSSSGAIVGIDDLVIRVPSPF